MTQPGGTCVGGPPHPPPHATALVNLVAAARSSEGRYGVVMCRTFRVGSDRSLRPQAGSGEPFYENDKEGRGATFSPCSDRRRRQARLRDGAGRAWSRAATAS